MAKIYNKKSVAAFTASTGNNSTAAFTYKGFSSQETKSNFKLYDIDLVKQDIITYIPFNINERMTFDFDRENNIIN